MSFSLTSDFKDVLEYEGQNLILDLSFDNVLRLFDMFSDDVFSYLDKEDIALEILLTPGSYENAKSLHYVDKHSLFLYIMKEFLDNDLENPVKSKGPKTFDFKQDAGIIYASFLQAYNMDLFQQQGKLHWKKFMQLFDNLPDKTKMKEVIGYRTRKVPSYNKFNADERKHLLEMKALYRLKGEAINEQEMIERNEENFNKVARMLKAQ